MARKTMEYIPLGKCGQWLSGGTPSLKRSEYWNGDIPWISANSMYSMLLFDSERKVTQKGAENGARLIPQDTILILVRGSILHQRVPIGITTRDVTFNQDVKALIPDKNNFLPKFLLYWLLAHEKFLLNKVDFTGIGAGRISTDILFNLPVPLVKLKEQERLVSIFQALDDKIELNRRMNETLEGMARAIFKSWFIDFDPVKRNIARKGGQNQPSPPSPLPEVEGRKANYRGGYDFSGLINTVRELRKKQTPAEVVFWELVRNRRLIGLKFRRQHQLGDYVVDFYCHDHRMVIELDGGVHASKRQKDHKRDAWMKARGFKVIRFANEQVLEDTKSVLEQIAACCGVCRGEGSSPLPMGDGQGEGFGSSPTGRGGGEGGIEELDALFPDSFQPSPLGPIPKGWEIKSLYETAEYINGAAFKSEHFCDPPMGLPVVKIAELKGGISAQTKYSKREMDSKYYIETGDMLYSWSGSPDTSLDVFLWAGGKGLLNQHIFKVVTKTNAEKHFVFFLLKYLRSTLIEIARNKQTTGLGHVTVSDMKRLNVCFPHDKVLEAFDNLFGDLFDKYFRAMLESEHLATIRDALLPKLLSGEIRVNGDN